MGIHTELRSLLAVNRGARPVIRPCDVPVLAQRNHGLDCEGHARLALAHRLILGVVWNIGRAVEHLVDAVADISPDDAAVLGLGVGLDDVAKLAEQSAGLYQLDGLVQTLTRSLDNANSVGIRLRPITNVVCLVQITVEALVVESHVEVDDVSVQQDPFIGNAVANDLVD